MRYYDSEIKALSSLYDILSVVADDFPDKSFQTYTKKQRQYIINSLITFLDENISFLSEEMIEILNPYPELSFDKLGEILKSANKKQINSTEMRRDEWIAFANRFDNNTKDALLRFINDCVFPLNIIFLPNSQTGNACFSSGYTKAYRQILHLESPVFSSGFNKKSHETDDGEIDIFDDGYRLSFVQEGEVMSVDFSDVFLDTQLLNYSTINIWSSSPWHQISDSLLVLRDKREVLGMSFLNDKEKPLCQLSEFNLIHNLDNPNQFISEDKKASEMFIEFANRIGNDRVVELTKKYVNAGLTNGKLYLNIRKKKQIRKALIQELSQPSSENLSRIILNEINEAVVEYPTEVELDVEIEVLEKSRKTVTEILIQRGYEGEYPHFRKMKSLKGIKLLEIQGQPVFVGYEKNMACMIDCYECSIDFNKLEIDYIVSTVFLKKDELQMYDSLDGFSGFFPYKNRRRARSILPNIDFRDDGEPIYSLEGITITAAKTAECKKLTKEERKNIISVGPGVYGFLFYGGFFLAIGFLFGLLLCPAMILFGLLLGVPMAAFSAEVTVFEFIRGLVLDFPWLWMFLFCVIGFGLPMTIVTAIAKRRG